MKQKTWLALLLLVLTLAGCGKQDEAPAEVPEDQEPTEDSGPPGLGIERAENFAIQYLPDGVKLLFDSAGRELLLVPEGARAPEGYQNAARITTPVRRAMFTSATQVGFLEALEDESLYGSIAALSIEEDRWTSQAVLDGFASGQTAYISPETWLAGEIEAVTAAAPELVFLDLSGEEGAALAALLDGAGIPYAAAAGWPEAGSEAQLEWMKFFAAFYNLDQEADILYDAKVEQLEERYAELSAIPERQRPVVAFCSAEGGVAYTQAGGSAIARQLERAGAVYALGELEGEGAVELSMEEFFNQCKDADVLIYASTPRNMAGTLLDEDPLFGEFKAYQEGRVFTLDSGYEMKRAQVVEEFGDIAAICHPELAEGHVFTLYQPLA